MRAEHWIALEKLRRRHELKTLHEALDLVFTSRFLPPYDVSTSAELGPQLEYTLSDCGIGRVLRYLLFWASEPLLVPETAAARTEEEKSR